MSDNNTCADAALRGLGRNGDTLHLIGLLLLHLLKLADD
jgi:hypothetical protein